MHDIIESAHPAHRRTRLVMNGSPLHYHDVFPHAVPLHLLPVRDGGRRAGQYREARARVLTQPMFHHRTGQRIYLRRTSAPPPRAVEYLFNMRAAERLQREPMEEERQVALTENERTLRSFRPVELPAVADDRRLDSGSMSDVVREWSTEFAAARRVLIADPVILQLGRHVLAEDRDFNELERGSPEVRFRLVPLWLDGNSEADRAAAIEAIRERSDHLMDKFHSARDGDDYNARTIYEVDAPGHWVLVVVDQLQRNLYLVDSMHEPHYRHALVQWLNLEGNPLSTYHRFDWMPAGDPQRTAYSCGYRVLRWIRYLLLFFLLGGAVPTQRMPQCPDFFPEGPDPRDQRKLGGKK